MPANEEITVLGVTVATREITINEAVYRQAARDERLDDEFDAWLSDMPERTVVVEPDGTTVHLYGGAADLLAMVTPVLDRIPTWIVEQYVTGRRMEEE